MPVAEARACSKATADDAKGRRLSGRARVAAACLLTALAALGGEAPANAALTDGLTFYASFDNSLSADFTAGGNDFNGPASFQPIPESPSGGAWGAGTMGVDYPMLANFDVGRGSLAFWYRSNNDFAVDNDRGRNLFSVTNTNFIISVGEDEPGPLRFMTGTNVWDPVNQVTEFKWDYLTSVPAEQFIQKDQWNHLAITWDQPNQSKAFYLNGNLADSTTTDRMRESGGSRINLGGMGFSGDFDEFVIWDRPIAPSDVSTLFTDPEGARQTLRAVQPPVTTPWRNEPAFVRYANPGDDLFTPTSVAHVVDVDLKNITNEDRVSRVDIELIDFFGRRQGPLETHTIDLGPGQTSTIGFNVNPADYGHYRVRATVRTTGVDGVEETRVRDVTAFSVLPDEPLVDHPFFGVHIQMTDGMAELGRRVGYTESRVHNFTQFTWWTHMQPNEGDPWQRRNYERFYLPLNDMGYSHLGQWYATPEWAAAINIGGVDVAPPDPGSPGYPNASGYPVGWVPDDMDDFRQYIIATMTEFPEIDKWEVWNEPHVPTFLRRWDPQAPDGRTMPPGDGEDYAMLVEVASTTAKSIRPEVRVVAMLPHSTNDTFLREALDAGVLNYADAVSYHAYIVPGTPASAIQAEIQAFREKLEPYGHRDIPLIMSEGGVPSGMSLEGVEGDHLPPIESREPIDVRAAAVTLVKSQIAMMAEGVETAHYYFHAQSDDATVGDPLGDSWKTVEFNGSARPKIIAQAMFVHMLAGRIFMEQYLAEEGDFRAYIFGNADHPTDDLLVSMWTEDGLVGETRLPELSGSDGVYDFMGNSLGTSPRQLVGDIPIYWQTSLDMEGVLGRLSMTVLGGPVIPAPASIAPFAPILIVFSRSLWRQRSAARPPQR